MSAAPLRVAGVPEHFCLPWLLALEEQLISDVHFVNAPGGTGQMMAMLEAREVDVAVSLTEGTVMWAAEHPHVQIVSVYVESPLEWGVHVSARSSVRAESELRAPRIAISRFFSGSHLMAYVFAERMGWDPQSLVFVAVGGLSGALQAFAEDRVDLFLWDRFMTSPLCENTEDPSKNVLRRIGVLPSPWPCFVVASTDAVLATRRDELWRILQAVSKRAQQFVSLATSVDRSRAVQLLEERYHLPAHRALEWLTTTQFAPPAPLDPRIVETVKRFLPRK